MTPLIETTHEEVLQSYDWKEAFGFSPYTPEDIAEVIATKEGANDEDPWFGVFRMKDGKFMYLEAWCDYTGWDCRSGGEGFLNETLEALRRWSMTKRARRALQLTLADLDGE